MYFQEQDPFPCSRKLTRQAPNGGVPSFGESVSLGFLNTASLRDAAKDQCHLLKKKKKWGITDCILTFGDNDVSP